ncbi:immunoglobulin-like domain-containing protein [Bacteroides gallinaceum]|uniref:Bacterial Ig-like domain-containing protein n=1 Tax=Bacteroides gallinaceum TaxID=1462571 RepID=A0ABT7VH62_9BACE|nr:immunoglobulin-like domain-containing protein [Bacteroides gallinaceum]MDM8325639.1 hypothetical protein [Bacteroides gallinaceum]
MKSLILSVLLSSVVCLSCTHKRQQSQPEGPAITGGNDTVTNIQTGSQDTLPDKDAIVYDIPECCLWYAEDLPDEYKNKPVSMWAEHSVYGENVHAVNLFVSNPTNAQLSFGRYWDIDIWNGEKWVSPNMKVSCMIWPDDEFVMYKGMLLHCFRFPVGKYYHLPKGKYRMNKSFGLAGKSIELNAEFEIK